MFNLFYFFSCRSLKRSLDIRLTQLTVTGWPLCRGQTTGPWLQWALLPRQDVGRAQGMPSGSQRIAWVCDLMLGQTPEKIMDFRLKLDCPRIFVSFEMIMLDWWFFKDEFPCGRDEDSNDFHVFQGCWPRTNVLVFFSVWYPISVLRA